MKAKIVSWAMIASLLMTVSLSVLMLLSVSILGKWIQPAAAQPLDPFIWSPYTRLSHTLTETRWAMVATNERYEPDHIVVVFTDNLTGQYDWYFTKSADGGATWTAPDIAVDPDFDVMSDELNCAAIAMDDNGTVHMSFARQKTSWPRDTSPTGIYYARYDGISWSAPITIYEELSPTYLLLYTNDITIGRNNIVHLAYGSDYPGNDNGDVWYSRSEDSGLTWAPPININAFNGMDCGMPLSLAADDFGYVYYATGDDWYNEEWTGETHFRRSQDDGATWDPQTAITRRENGDYGPRLMCNNAGGVYIVWNGYPSPNLLLFKYSIDHGSNWTPYYGGIALMEDAPGMATDYFAELDDYGFIHIVYSSTATGTRETYYMRINTTGNIIIPSQIITPDDGYPSHPTGLAVTGDQIYVATKDLRDGNWEAYFLFIMPHGWPMFHNNLQHTGYSTSTAPDTNYTKWIYGTGHWIMNGPAVASGMVYVGSDDQKIYCLNASTGAFAWSYQVGGSPITCPAIADGKVYVGSADHKVYCFNATTGILIWSYTTGSGCPYSSPAIADGKVYIGSTDHKVYCLNDTTGMHIWNYTAGHQVTSSPAVDDARVYVGSVDYKVYCLNASTGALLWSCTTGNQVSSSPAVACDRVYIGSGDHNVYCLNATTGSSIWQYSTGGIVDFSSPAIAYDRIYIGSRDDKVYCLNATSGALIWSYTTGNWVLSSPAVADGKVYVGSVDRKVYCLNATTGALIWSYTTGYDVRASPAVAYGNVYVASMDGGVYCFGPPPPYDATINAYCNTEGLDVSVNIVMDGSPTGYTTPHTFTSLTGTHNFTVPNTDPSGHPFKQWSTGETSTTITVSSGGTYTAYYEVVTTIYIDPSALQTKLNKNFTVDVRIANVTDLYLWELKLYYRNTIINATQEIEGPFLKSGGATIWIDTSNPDYNATHGLVYVCASLLGEIPGVNGSGVIASIKFEAIALGNSTLDVTDTLVLDSDLFDIPHNSFDGYVNVTTPIHDIAIVSVTPNKNTVSQGYSMKSVVTICNKGDFAETFNVTLYGNTTIIGEKSIVNLAPNTNTSLAFTWNTTGVPKGNYTITAATDDIPGDANTTDNTYTDGTVLITISGDVSGDKKVDGKDIAAIAKAFGSQIGQPNYNPNADINDDGKIDGRDLGIACKNYGKTNP